MAKLELVYKLNYPPLNEVLTEEFAKELFETGSIITKGYGKEQINHFVRIPDTRGKIKDSFIFQGDLTFLEMEIFLKSNGTRGVMHRDTPNQSMAWGINYVVGGDSTMEYYDINQLKPIMAADGKYVKNAGGGYSTFYTNKKGTGLTPIASYSMAPGVYLINGDVPHIATGTKDRMVLSMRSSKDYNLTWSQVVEKFKQSIIDW